MVALEDSKHLCFSILITYWVEA